MRVPGSTRAEPDSQARTPTGAANAVRLAVRCPTHGEPGTRAIHRCCVRHAVGLRRRAHRAQCARALHNMLEAACGLRPHGPPSRELARKARTLTGTADAMRLGLWRPAYRAPDARALHHLPKRPATSGDVDRRRRNPASQAWPPAGPANALWLALRVQRSRLTASQMRALGRRCGVSEDLSTSHRQGVPFT
jgi:hypothetical protein